MAFWSEGESELAGMGCCSSRSLALILCCKRSIRNVLCRCGRERTTTCAQGLSICIAANVMFDVCCGKAFAYVHG